MPTSSVGPLGPYDLILQDKASSPSTTLGLMLDLDDQGAPRVREFRVPAIPPRQSQGFMADSSLDPLVDYIYVQDDWSGGAIRPYYREGDRRYAEADDVDARWEGVLALGMKQDSPRSIAIENSGWEVLPSGWTIDVAKTNGAPGNWVATLGGLDSAYVTIRATGASPWDSHSGNNFLTVSDAASGGLQYSLTYTIPGGASWIGRTINFGAYIRGSSSVTGRIVIMQNGSEASTGAVVSATSWTWKTLSYLVPAGTTSIGVRIRTDAGSSASGTVSYDDLLFWVSTADTALPVVEAAGSWYTAIGPIILIWDETYDFWKVSTVEAAGTQATGIISYKNKVYIGYGLSVAYIYGTDGSWTVASGGSGNDTYAQFFTVQDNKLWKNEAANTVRYSVSDPAAATTWLIQYTAGEVSAPITGMYMLNSAVIVGTETGLHIWSNELLFKNVTNQFTADPDPANFAQGIVRGSWLYLTTAKQGLVRFNGYTLEDLSEIFMAPRLTNYGGRVKAITQDQHQLYLLVDTPTVDTSTSKTTRLMSLRNVGGEWQLHILANVDIGDINSLAVAGNYLYALGRLQETNAGLIISVVRWTLPQKSAAPFQDDITVRALQTTGTFNLPVFHAAGVAALIKVELLVEDTDSANTIAVKFGLDGAAPSTTTLGTVTTTTTTTAAKVTLNASSLTTPTNAYGRFWQFQLVFTRDSTQATGAHESPKVYAFVAHFVLAPIPVPAWEIYVRLGAPLKNGLLNPESKTTTLSSLNTLETQPYPITLVEDFDMNNSESLHYVRIREWERVLEDQEVHKGQPAVAGELYRLVLQKIV